MRVFPFDSSIGERETGEGTAYGTWHYRDVLGIVLGYRVSSAGY